MRAVNLLPRDHDRQPSDRGRLPIVVAAGGLVLVTAVTAFLVMSASSEVSDQRSQLESLEAPAPQGPSADDQAAAFANGVVAAQERANRVAALSSALSTRVPMDRVLRDLAYVLPADVWLTSFTAAVPTAATPTGAPAPAASGAASVPDGVTIQGATYSEASVARVLARLSAMPSLDGVRLTETSRAVPDATSGAPATKKKKKPKPVVTFTITASLDPGSIS